MARDIPEIMRDLLEVLVNPQFYQASYQARMHMEAAKFYDHEELIQTLTTDGMRSRLRLGKVKSRFDDMIYNGQGVVKDYLQCLVS